MGAALRLAVALYSVVRAWAMKPGVLLSAGMLAEYMRENGVVSAIQSWVVSEAAQQAGINLDPDAPFSDASLSGAFSEKTGIAIRSLKDRAMIEEDIDAHAAAMVSDRSGYTVRSVRNVEVLKEDITNIGISIVSDRLGIPLGITAGEVWDSEAIKARVLEWAKAELMTRLGGEVAIGVQEILAAGSLEAVANDLNSSLSAVGSAENVTARQIAVKLAGVMATTACVNFGKTARAMSRLDRRRELNRAAQQRFRAAHGNRQQYIPLGMTSVVSGT